MSRARILVVDDEEVMRDILTGLMERSGHLAEAVASGEAALERCRELPPDLVLLDLMLPGIDGMETLKQLKQLEPDRPVIMVTAYGTVETAIEAIKLGASDYLLKPFRNDEVKLCVSRALSESRLKDENRCLKRELEGRQRLDGLVWRSQKMRAVYDLVTQVAPSRSTVLVQGESGTGKELVARAIHNLSQRPDGRFVVVNSANMPADLLESNLFGHTRGAFTGASSSKKGLFEVADGGSLFFDEISNIDPSVQVKLLRVLQDREYMPLGGTESFSSDVRIIAATNTDLGELVQAGRFREDLYYRINVIRIRLPPLRERPEDIPALVEHFIGKYSRENSKQVRGLTPAALRSLETRDWPGNVRELENVIQRAVVLARSEEIEEELVASDDSPPRRRRTTGSQSYRQAVEAYQRELILDALERAGGVQKTAAELLRLRPTTLSEKMKRLGLRDT